MQSELAERRRQPARGRRRVEPRGNLPRVTVSSVRRSEEEISRFKEIITIMQREVKQAGDGGGGGGGGSREGDKEGETGRGRDRGRGDREGRRAASEGRGGGKGSEEEEEEEEEEAAGRLRWRVNRLEKEKLELTSSHNQEVCRLQAELTRLRSSLERGEAQRVELQYQLTVSQRDADRAAKLSRDNSTLTERAAELQQTVQELQKALDITRQAREEDQHALQQEMEERDKLIQSFSSENQRMHRLLQDQEEALEESERRMTELQREREKEEEVKRRQGDELKHLKEREERSRLEAEASNQRVRSLESNLEVERAAHLESKFNSEIIQLRVRDLEAVLAVQRSGQQEAQQSLELLRAQLRGVERAHSLERERSSSMERALQRLQTEYEHCKSELSVTLETERKMTSDLTEQLQEEKKQHADTHLLLEQAAQRQSDTEVGHVTCLQHIRETLQQHNNNNNNNNSASAVHDGKQSPCAEVQQLLKTTLAHEQLRREETEKQIQDQLRASERLQQEIQALQRLNSDQSRRLEESQQASVKLEEELTRLRQESSDWSTQGRCLQAELEREREERGREREKEREERGREREKEREEREREKEETTAEVRKISEQFQKESKARLSFLYCLYQRLLAGCVLLNQPHSILGNFTWKELCDVITEQVDGLTSDLQKANDKVAHLQRVCDKKSACVRELQRSQECVLSRLEESVRRREEAWSSQHTHTVSQLESELQVCRSQCNSLRGHASSLTSDLSRSRAESASLLSACALLAGGWKHDLRRLRFLCEQKNLLCGRLAEREVLEEEVRSLADALGGEEEEEEGRGRRRAVRRWRRSVWVVLAARRWRTLAKQTTVLFRLEGRGGGSAVCVCGELATARQKGQNTSGVGDDDDDDDDGDDDGDEGRAGVCARWLRSKRLCSAIVSSMSDLQGALAHTDVTSAARTGLSRLLHHLLDQSDAAPAGVDEDTPSGRLRLGLDRVTPPPPQRRSMKAVVSTLQQHFLLFSQRLHSAEVERRSLRLEVANLKRGLRQEREDTCRTVPVQRFHSVCVELGQALNREQEAQTLIQEQTNQLHTLQRRVDTHTSEQTDTQHTLSHATQALSEARHEARLKERSLRILGKYLSGVQKERKQLEERLQRAEEELRDAARRKDQLISYMKAAETNYKEVRETLIQSRHSLSAQPRPLLLPLPKQHLELSGAESIMGAAEVAACQSLLSVVSQVCHTCASRIDWLEQEVAAHRSHVTALRCELQDACLRDNQAFVPVTEFPETFPLADVETPPPVLLSDSSKDPAVCLNPAPSSPLSKQPPRTKAKEKKTVKKSRGQVKSVR